MVFAKIKEKKEVVRLRRLGYSYSEILKEVRVAKSSLSLWLHSVDLSKKQKQRLTLKKIRSIRRGHKIWMQMRIKRTRKITKEAQDYVKKLIIDEKELFLMGTMLYWAEGSKQKNRSVSQGVVFSNSDPKMIKLFLKWLKKSIKIPREQIKLEIYLHEKYRKKVKKVIGYWSKITGFFRQESDRIYFKKHKVYSVRENQRQSYYGQLRIVIRKSTDLNRKIQGWIEGICFKCGVV